MAEDTASSDAPQPILLQQALVSQLVQGGSISDPAVEAAFRAMPRHLFLPDVPLEQIYQDLPIVTKYEQETPISSSTQPWMMASISSNWRWQRATGPALACASEHWSGTVLATGLWGIRHGARWVWWTVALAGSADFGGRSGHLEASYLNLLHLAPAVIALVVFAASLALLWPYLCRPSPPHRSQTR